jgi:hypothetical protein
MTRQETVLVADGVGGVSWVGGALGAFPDFDGVVGGGGGQGQALLHEGGFGGFQCASASEVVVFGVHVSVQGISVGRSQDYVGAVRIGIGDAALDTLLRCFGSRVLDGLALPCDVFLERGERALDVVGDFGLALLAVNDGDHVGDIGGALRVGVVDADFDEGGVAHFLQVHGTAELEIHLLHGEALAGR